MLTFSSDHAGVPAAQQCPVLRSWILRLTGLLCQILIQGKAESSGSTTMATHALSVEQTWYSRLSL